MASDTTQRDRTAGGPSYWEQSRRPLASLLVVLPLLVLYELGVLTQGPAALRNGADVWLRQLLRMIGFGQYFLLPLLTVSILLVWHHTSRQPWRVSGRVLGAMAAECLLLAFCLRGLFYVQGVVFGSLIASLPAAPAAIEEDSQPGAMLGTLIGFLGAGVYEELLFRLMLLPATVWLLIRLGRPRHMAIATAVVLTSLFFAAAHHVGPHGEPWHWFSAASWFTLVFRFLAGVFFSVLFVARGFGIAAGTHAAYDVLVGISLLTCSCAAG